MYGLQYSRYIWITYMHMCVYWFYKCTLHISLNHFRDEDRAPWALGSSGLLSVPRLQSETHYTSYKDSQDGMEWDGWAETIRCIPIELDRTWPCGSSKAQTAGREPSRVQPWFLRRALWWFRMTWDSNNINNHQPTVGFEWFWWGSYETYVYASIWIV